MNFHLDIVHIIHALGRHVREMAADNKSVGMLCVVERKKGDWQMPLHIFVSRAAGYELF